MKRFVFIALAVCLLTVHVFAYDAPNLTPEDGNTVLGTFITSVLTDDNKNKVREWLDSDLNLMVYVPSTERYLLLDVTALNSIVVTRTSNGLAELYFREGATGTVWDVNGSELTFAAVTTFSATTYQKDCVIVGGRYMTNSNVTLPTPTNTYVADIQGSLLLRDDGGLMSDPETEEGGGILGFLSDFWNKLKDFFIGLFVPEDGYFQQWYQSLKTAVDKKLSAISALYNGLTGFFNSLSGRTTSIVLEIPANHFYAGSPSVSADIFEKLGSVLSFLRGVLTGAIVLFTAIICYKKLVTIFSE